ncbi:MAG: hypothetical protein AB7K86_14930 [Rhodospirillales bacterium]
MSSHTRMDRTSFGWRMGVMLAMALALGACATSGADMANMTPAQRELHQRTARFNETVATGAGVGCLVGAVIGAAATGEAKYAAVGCGAGAVAGGAGGYYLASRNEKYANREQAANARIAAARKEADDLSRTAQLADQVTRENKARLAQLESRYRAGQIDAATFRKEAEAARNDLKTIKTASDKASDVSRTMGQDARQTGDAGVGREAARVQQAQRQLQQSANELEDALNRVPAA